MAGNRRARVRPGSSRKRSARWSADIAATSATALSVGRCSKRRAGRSSSGWLRVRTAWSKGSAASTRAAAPGSMALSASAMSASCALPSVRATWTGSRFSSRLSSMDSPSGAHDAKERFGHGPIIHAGPMDHESSVITRTGSYVRSWGGRAITETSAVRALVRRAAGAGGLVQELVPLVLEPPHQLPVGGRAHDLVELGAVVGDEAHVLDEDVVDQPSVAAVEQPRLDRHLRALLRDHLRTDDRVVAVDRLADVANPLAAVLVDPHDVGALEQVGEELGELLALLRRPRPPVACQRPLGRLRDIEDLLRDLADCLPAGPGLERGIIEHLGDLVAVLAELVRGRPGPSGRRHPNDQDEPEEDCRHRLHHDREYTTARRAGSRTTSHAAAVIRARAARYTARTPSAWIRRPPASGPRTPRTPASVAPIATYWAARAGPAISITTIIHTSSSPIPRSASVTELATSTQGLQASAQIAGVAAPMRYIIHNASRLERRSTSPPHHAPPTSVAAAAAAAKTPTCAVLTCRTSTRSSG